MGARAPESPGATPIADRLQEIAVAKLDEARQRGKTGVDIYAAHDARSILGDLDAFLEADNGFRLDTGAVPRDFEAPIPAGTVAGIEMRGFVDRIDWTPDGRSAWVIDYKTGKTSGYEGVQKGPDRPLDGGRKLQLPAYAAAAQDAEHVQTLYWFISQRGEFKRITYNPTPADQQRFEATVGAILGGIGGGAFPAVPGEDDDFLRQLAELPLLRLRSRLFRAARSGLRPQGRRRRHDRLDKRRDDGEGAVTVAPGHAAADDDARRDIREMLDETFLVEAGAGTGKTSRAGGTRRLASCRRPPHRAHRRDHVHGQGRGRASRPRPLGSRGDACRGGPVRKR